MQTLNLSPLYLSIHLSTITTIILLITSMPISWWLSQTKRKKIKMIIESMTTLPLVLPPTILGFYLLILFNPHWIIGKIWFITTKTTLAFSFTGLVLGSCIYSLPFAIQPIQIAFEKIGKQPIEQAIMLKLSKIKIFFKVILPLSKNGIITAAVLIFTHTLGEFGVVLMIGGNIPGKTQVVSISIYESVEQLNYHNAHILAIIVIALSFAILLILSYINKK
ncbi:MAG TPA: molybdate ABC transporter permease subunit [Candidatus Azoamicus sp. OHIO1]